MRTTLSPGYLFDAMTTLVGRELRIRYKGSLLGILWAVLSPLATVAILHLLFTRILALNIPHYAAFIYSGLIPWTWFQATLQTSAAALLDNRDLVRKPFFPRAILPMVVTSTNFLLYLLALGVLLALMAIDGVAITPALLLVPIVWLAEGLFIVATAVLVAALGVLVRDVQHLLNVAMLLWFYLTPIFYDPERLSPELAGWFRLNPLAVFVQAHRSVTLYGRQPEWLPLAAWAVVAALLLAGSLWLFRALEDIFVEEV